MKPVRLRPYEDSDLGEVLRLWADTPSLLPEIEVGAGLLSPETTHLATVRSRVVGTITCVVAGAQAWIVGLSVDEAAEGQEVRERLLRAAEESARRRGARQATVLVNEPDDQALTVLEGRGYRHRGETRYYERDLGRGADEPIMEELGARLIDPDLWERLDGMEDAKRLIERRVILPLAEPELARRHAVAGPRGIVLFGPPGTGKTTFAKATASRLDWPFIELFPPELGASGEAAAGELRQFFNQVLELPKAVVFLDEVEDVAAARETLRKVDRAVTNELLKQIPRLRDAPYHLLVCATNSVRTLDEAFLRPGRFDYILPIGPPDDDARRAIWRRYVREITEEERTDLEALVGVSEFFTAADIEFAARKAAQRAFETEASGESSYRATTDDFLSAIAETPPTLDEEAIRAFEEDVERFARL